MFLMPPNDYLKNFEIISSGTQVFLSAKHMLSLEKQLKNSV